MSLTVSTMSIEPTPEYGSTRLCALLHQKHGCFTWTSKLNHSYAFRYGIPKQVHGTLLRTGMLAGFDTCSVRILLHELPRAADFTFSFVYALIDKNKVLYYPTSADTKVIHMSSTIMSKKELTDPEASILFGIISGRSRFLLPSKEFEGALFDACWLLEDMTNAK